MNCTPFVRQVWYNTCTKELGVFSMPKGVPNKRYTPEFKKLVIETMQEEKLSYSETCRRFEVNSRDRIKSWERIYLEEGPEGLTVERRGRNSKGRPPKQLPKEVEEDLLTDGSYRRREVIRCQTVGEELRLTFTGVPYGTYSLEESGISVCKLIISSNNTQAEIALP